MIYATETFAQIVEDIKPLLATNWRELALHKDSIPLDPDFSFYEKISDAGGLVFYSVRTAGCLCGYAIYFLSPKHPHYRTSFWAVSDIVFVAPEYRNMGVGNALFEFIEADMTARGVNVLMTGTKVKHPELSTLLQMRGHFPTDKIFGKLLCPL